MKSFSSLLACALAAAGLLLAVGSEAQAQAAPPTGYKAWIAIKQEGGLCRIEPTCQAPEDASLVYRLTARKVGRSGVSSSAQSGKVGVKAGTPKVLCHLSLGINPGDRYEFSLEVFKDGTKVAEALAASPQAL